MRKHLLSVLLATCCVAGVAATAALAAGGPRQPNDGAAEFTTAGGVDPSFLTDAKTIPHWTFQYTDPTNGATYPITMVGSDPRESGSTTIRTEIVPLTFRFAAGNQDMSIVNDAYGTNASALDWTADPTAGGGSSDVAKTLASPIFGDYAYDADLGGDTGQYGDVFMRAQFDRIGSGYHVKLQNTSVLPAVTIDVPQSQGVAYQRPAGATAGIVEVSWFSEKIQNLMNALKIDPTTVPIFLTHNVLLYIGHDRYTNCCILGYHGAGIPIGYGAGSANGKGKQPVQTFMYAAYTSPNTYSGFSPTTAPNRGLSDIHGLSHEVAEWLDDPFVNNAVQPWITPTAPQYGCTGVLETGDPVVGVWFPLSGNPDASAFGVWHPEDEVFLNWFARNGEPAGLSPWSSYYTFMGARTIGIGGLYAGWGSLPATC